MNKVIHILMSGVMMFLWGIIFSIYLLFIGIGIIITKIWNLLVFLYYKIKGGIWNIYRKM